MVAVYTPQAVPEAFTLNTDLVLYTQAVSGQKSKVLIQLAGPVQEVVG